jgi:hypothetical protein
MRTMVISVPELTAGPGVRFVAVTLPYVEAILDGKKYRLPGDMPRLEGTEAYRARAPRGPTLRSLVKLALRCQSAEEMGLRLKRRFDRSLRRHGIAPGRARRAEAEAELDRLLGQD